MKRVKIWFSVFVLIILVADIVFAFYVIPSGKDYWCDFPAMTDDSVWETEDQSVTITNDPNLAGIRRENGSYFCPIGQIQFVSPTGTKREFWWDVYRNEMRIYDKNSEVLRCTFSYRYGKSTFVIRASAAFENLPEDETLCFHRKSTE